MKLYFLALGTLLVLCVGCAYDGQQILQNDEYYAPPAQMLAHPGPMVHGPGPAKVKAKGSLSVADAWIASLAILHQCELVHKDPEFDRVNELTVIRLPYK